MGLCLYVDLCFHASSLPCLHTFWHAIPTSFYILNVFFSFLLQITILYSNNLTRLFKHSCTSELYLCSLNEGYKNYKFSSFILYSKSVHSGSIELSLASYPGSSPAEKRGESLKI